jgi:hypothetical protein
MVVVYESSNKLEYLSLAVFSCQVKCLWVKPGVYPKVEHLLIPSLPKDLALWAKSRLG